MCSKKQIFYSIDIIRDLRYVSDAAKSDDRFKWVIGDCLDLAIFSRIDQIPKNVDFLFLDTIHTYEHVKNEFYVWEPLLVDKCLVAIDDIRLNDKGKFFDEMSYQKYDLTHLCHTSGFGIFFYQRTDRGSVQEAIIRSCMVMTRRNKEMIQDLYQELNKLKASLPYRVCHKLYKVYHKLSGSELEE